MNAFLPDTGVPQQTPPGESLLGYSLLAAALSFAGCCALCALSYVTG